MDLPAPGAPPRAELPLGGAAGWRVGGRAVRVERGPADWRVWSWPVAATGPLQLLPEPGEPPPTAERARFAWSRSGGVVHVGPSLPDRALVLLPECPVQVGPDDALTFTVTLPAWVRVAVEAGPVLCEAAPERLPETWLGTDTRTGELCYGSRSRWSLAPGPPLGAWGVRCPVRVANRGAAPLLLQRLRVPAPALPLWWDEGQVWAPLLHIEGDADDRVSVTVAEGPPAQAPRAVPFAPPRVPADAARSWLAFHALFRRSS
jgi:hypothetical protein